MLIPTPRLLLLALAGIIPIALADVHDVALGVALVWLVAMVVVAIVDGAFSPRQAHLIWSRKHETKLSLGVWNPVELRLDNRSRRNVALRVRDALPPHLISSGATGEGRCPAGATWRLRYDILPDHRGEYTVGPATVRYLGPLGLIWRQHRIDLSDPVKVYPNLLALRTYDSVMRRGQLQEIGLRNSRRWGSGTEFERLRDYTPDDDIRQVNWPATARRHSPIAVDYRTERSQNILVVLDAGRRMSTRVRPFAESGDVLSGTAVSSGARVRVAQPLTRLDYAVNAALLLAFVSQQYGDRVGLLAFSDRILRYLAPRPGRSHFIALTEALYGLEAEATEADHAAGLAYLGAKNPRRSLLLLFTDLAEQDADTALVSCLAPLSRRHLPMVITLQDPDLFRLGTRSPRDSESTYERAVARSVLDDREKILEKLQTLGILTLDVSAERLSPALINRYLEIKARSAL